MIAKINGVVVVGTPEEIIKYKELDSKSEGQSIFNLAMDGVFRNAAKELRHKQWAIGADMS